MDPYALSDEAWCKELGRRLDHLREDRRMSRDQLGEETGVSQPTIRRLLDEGHGKLSTLIAALRSLEALDQLGTFIEPPPVNPAVLWKKRGRTVEPGAISDRPSRRQNPEENEDGELGW